MIDTATLVTHADRLPTETFDWGTLLWLANGQVLPGTTQTLGLCHLSPGQRNPLHYHPNCEDLLYIWQGRGKHLLDEQWIPVEPGTTVRVPIGMKHQLINECKETMICVIVFSCAERQTVFLE